VLARFADELAASADHPLLKVMANAASLQKREVTLPLKHLKPVVGVHELQKQLQLTLENRYLHRKHAVECAERLCDLRAAAKSQLAELNPYHDFHQDTVLDTVALEAEVELTEQAYSYFL
jgi:hypothetical protein